MKFCKDCKHYRNNWSTLWSPYCARQATRNTDPVTGKVTLRTKLVECYFERLFFDPDSECHWLAVTLPSEMKELYCGNDAQFWEPKV